MKTEQKGTYGDIAISIEDLQDVLKALSRVVLKVLTANEMDPGPLGAYLDTSFEWLGAARAEAITLAALYDPPEDHSEQLTLPNA